MKRQLLLIVALLHCLILFGQQRKIATVELHDVQSAYVDRPGDVYILQKDNTLKKFDSLGNLIFEKKYNPAPTIFDPRDGARLFAYQKETNHFAFYSEETKQEFKIEQHYAIEPLLVCSSGDHNIWVLDRADLSLKRINPTLTKVLAEAPVDQKQFLKQPEFIGMREYQNFLFLLDRNSGILIFNSIGIQIKKISSSNIEYINFLGEELYYKIGGKLFFYDLFDSTSREVTVDPSCLFQLLTDSRTYTVYSNRLDIYQNR